MEKGSLFSRLCQEKTLRVDRASNGRLRSPPDDPRSSSPTRIVLSLTRVLKLTKAVTCICSPDTDEGLLLLGGRIAATLLSQS